MRQVDVHPKAPSPFTEEQLTRLEQWLSLEMHDAMGVRKVLENHWRDLLRMYESVPKNPVRNYPVEMLPTMKSALELLL